MKTARQWIFTANPKKVEVTLHKIPCGTIAAVTLGADVEESIRIRIAMWLGENRLNAEHTLHRRTQTSAWNAFQVSEASVVAYA